MIPFVTKVSNASSGETLLYYKLGVVVSGVHCTGISAFSTPISNRFVFLHLFMMLLFDHKSHSSMLLNDHMWCVLASLLHLNCMIFQNGYANAPNNSNLISFCEAKSTYISSLETELLKISVILLYSRILDHLCFTPEGIILWSPVYPL